jgi:hypothetical protein
MIPCVDTDDLIVLWRLDLQTFGYVPASAARKLSYGPQVARRLADIGEYCRDGSAQLAVSAIFLPSISVPLD